MRPIVWMAVALLSAILMPGSSCETSEQAADLEPTVYGIGLGWRLEFVVSLEHVEGDLWVGSYGALQRLDRSGNLVPVAVPESVECAIGPEERTAWKRVSHFAMYPVRWDPYKETVWVGLNDAEPCVHGDYIVLHGSWLKPGGLLCFESARGAWRFYAPTLGKVSSRAYSIAFDSSSIWIWGQYPLVSWEKEGVYRHDRRTREITFIPSELGYSHGIWEPWCRVPTDLLAVFGDGLWFGQAELFDQAGLWVSFADMTGRPNPDISVVEPDGDLLWFGYNSGAIVCYHRRLGAWEFQGLPLHRGAITSFAFTDDFVLAGVACLELDREKKDVFSGGGILVLDRKLEKWGYVSNYAQIPSLSTNALLLDGDSVWIGTNRGLVTWPLPGLMSATEWVVGERDTAAGVQGACR